MPLSWNEIKTRAVEFSKEWENETSEDAEAQTFWNGFFNVFGMSRKRLASFEQHVKKLNNKDGWIDLFASALIPRCLRRGSLLCHPGIPPWRDVRDPCSALFWIPDLGCTRPE